MDTSAGSPGRVFLEAFTDYLHLTTYPGGCRAGGGCETCMEYRKGVRRMLEPVPLDTDDYEGEDDAPEDDPEDEEE